MIGTLDSQVIEKFKEFQKKTGKYSDMNIENVEIEREVLNNLIDISLSGVLILVQHEAIKVVTVFDAFEARIDAPNSDETLVLPCQIIRLEAHPLHPSRTDEVRLAARFQPMNEVARKHLVNYIEAAARQARAAASKA